LIGLKLDDYETTYRSSFWFHNTYASIVNRGGMEDNYVDGSIPREATFDITRSQFGTYGDLSTRMATSLQLRSSPRRLTQSELLVTVYQVWNLAIESLQ